MNIENPKQTKVPIIFLAGKITNQKIRYGLINCAMIPQDFKNPSEVNLRNIYVDGNLLYQYAGTFVDYGDTEESKELSQRILTLPNQKQQLDVMHKITFERSMKGIDLADYIFFWIQQSTCFGTLVEIGYAYKQGKHIIIGYSNNIQAEGQMWFAFQCGKWVKQFENAQLALNWAFTLIKQ